jgi:hypothetical protein
MHSKLNFLVTLLLVCYRTGRLEEPFNILAHVHKKRPPTAPLTASVSVSPSHECFINAGTAKASLSRFVTQTALCASLKQRFDASIITAFRSKSDFCTSKYNNHQLRIVTCKNGYEEFFFFF